MRLRNLLFILPVTLLVACHSKDPKMIGTPPEGQRKAEGGTMQALNAKVDILFVIDDSGSMDYHQKNLSSNLDLFLDGLKQNQFIDYHVGAISTSEELQRSGMNAGPGSGRLNGQVRFVTRNTPNGINILKDNLEMGIWGSATEKMFSTTYLALTEPNLSGYNVGFYRPGAFLATVFLTDAEDQSDLSEYGYPRSPTDPLNISPQGLYDFLVGLKGDARRVMSYAAFIPSTVRPTDCNWDDSGMPHVRLEEFFTISKAITYNLCDIDFGKKLAEIGKDLTRRVGKTIFLDRRPKLETIQVIYGQQKIEPHATKGWAYDGNQNAIILGDQVEWEEQLPGTQLEVYFDPI